MRRAVNAAGEPRQDYIAAFQIGGFSCANRSPLVDALRAPTMASSGYSAKCYRLSRKGRGRVGDCRQCRRIVRVGERDLAPAGSVQPAKFGTYVRLVARQVALACARCIISGSSACLRGRPVTLDQFDEGAGAYRRRAD